MVRKKFYSPQEYVRIISNLYGFDSLLELNCLAFALGLTSLYESREKYILPTSDINNNPITCEASFELVCHKFNIRIKRVTETEEDHRYLRLYGWIDNHNFHVVRQEPNGILVHKPGWNGYPTETTEQELYELYECFGEKYVLYEILE